MNVTKKHFSQKSIWLLLMVFLLLSACGTGRPDQIKIFTPGPEQNQGSSLAGATEVPSGQGDQTESEEIPAEVMALLDTGVEEAIDENVPGIPGQIPNSDGYQWNTVVQGFNSPVRITHAEDDSGRLFVVEQGGLVWVLNEYFELYPEPFLDIQEKITVSAEQGLLDMIFSPDFLITGHVYAIYTNLDGDTIVSRFTTDRFKQNVNEALEQEVLVIEKAGLNHTGGQLAFGPDEYLYIGIGDGSRSGDPSGNAQSLDSLLGKILRVNVDLRVEYTIPLDNPYFGLSGKEEIWASGLSNPSHFSFDQETGDIYIADIGFNEWEEINFLPADTLGGTNFGWNYYEGTHVYGGTAPGVSLVPPLFEYSHSDGNCAVVGGSVYRGMTLPEWDGVYFYGDRCTGKIWGVIHQEDGTWIMQEIFDLDIWIATFGEDQFGELYLADFNTGDIYRLDK